MKTTLSNRTVQVPAASHVQLAVMLTAAIAVALTATALPAQVNTAADKAWHARYLCRQLEVHKANYREARNSLEAALKRHGERTQKRSELYAMADANDISVEGTLPIFQFLEKEKIVAEIQCCATESRIMALRKAIDKISRELQALPEQDKVVEKLQAIVAHHQRNVDRIHAVNKQIKNSVSAAEIAEAEAELAEAELRIVVLEEEHLRKVGSAEVLAPFNRQLIELTVDQAENEARRDFITERLHNIRPVLRLIEEYRQLNIMTPTAESVDQLRTKLVQRQRECADAEQQLQGLLEQLKHGPTEAPAFADPAGSEGDAAKEPEKP